MNLPDFLLARFKEDWEVIGTPEERPWQPGPHWVAANGLESGHDGLIAHPPRMRTHCEAHILVVVTYQEALAHRDAAENDPRKWIAFQSVVTALYPILAQLALAYAEHPDYRQEWQP